MRRHLLIWVGFAVSVCSLQAATLERLSLEEMAGKSTSIVRGNVLSSWAAFSGPVIYTHFRIQVTERLKGSVQSSVEVLVPGGVANNLRQTFSGTPEFKTGEEYVFFLWTGKGNLTQVIGLTQGLFSLAKDNVSDPTATRAATREMMLDRATGQAVKDQTLVMKLSELRTRIAAAQGTKGK